MSHVVRIIIVSGNLSMLVDPVAKSTLARTRARARRVKCRDETVFIAQETVTNVTRIDVMSGDLTFVVQYLRTENNGPLTGSGSRARGIEAGNNSLLGTNVPVTHRG